MDYFGSQDTILWCKYASKDETAFVKFKINNNFKQNIDETDSKQLRIHRKIHTGTSLWILKISRKKICEPNFVIANKKIRRIGYGFKNL